MQFIKDATDNAHLITGIGTDSVRVNDEVVRGSVILTASTMAAWDVESVGELCDEHWADVLARKPEVVILGTGTTLVFPEPAQLKALYAQHIGVEVMDTEAACRTHNLLVHEGRKVATALILPSQTT